MKNNYLKYGIIFCILVFAIFSAVTVFYTKSNIDEFNDAVYREIIEINNTFIFHFEDDSTELFERDLINVWEHYFRSEYTNGSGFYSSATDLKNGNVIIDSTGYTSSLAQTVPDLDSKARNMIDERINEGFSSDKSVNIHSHDDGIFNTTVMSITDINDNDYLLSYGAVFNPFQSVIRLKAGAYIAGLTAFIVIEAAVLISFMMLYRNQKNYELRNQKLTRGIAHELKTPLAVTKATVENWDYLDDNMRREHSKNIISEVGHMSEMVDRLLEVSQISGGNVKINPEAVDLLKLTRNTKERNSELLRERNIRFTITGDENSYPVYADPDMMNIVIGNFVSNAIKYCDREITVDFERTGKKITFSITNDGAVIGKKDLDKIWDIFYTTDKARTNRMSNSGVGLSLVKSILDAHKAKYGCTSGAGGTTFRFTMDRFEPSK